MDVDTCHGSGFENDPVLSEVPVYLNRLQEPPFVCGDVYALLNSLRPSDRPYGDQGQLSTVELEDTRHRVRMTYTINNSSTDYDVNSEYSIESHALIGTPRDSTSAAYCMGVSSAVGLTLIPISAVCTVRPCFYHVDADVTVRKTGAAEPEEASLAGKALHYQQLARMLKSGSAWRLLDFYDSDSVEASDLFDIIAAGSNSSRIVKFDNLPSTRDYLCLLSSSTGASVSSSSLELSRLDISRQVEAIMKRSPVIRFGDLLALLPPNSRARYSDAEVLQRLESCAILVTGGLWILQSHLSSHRSALWDTRDALLLLLHANRDITVPILANIANLVKEDIEEILLPICQIDILTNTWRIKKPIDLEFATKFPDCVKRQDLVVTALVARLKARRGRPATDSVGSTDKMVQILTDNGALTVAELKTLLQAQSKEHFISDAIILQTLQAVGAVAVRERWTLPARTGNSQLDALRMNVLQMFHSADTVTKEQVLAATDCKFSDHEIRRTIKEFANNVGGIWQFRGTCR